MPTETHSAARWLSRRTPLAGARRTGAATLLAAGSTFAQVCEPRWSREYGSLGRLYYPSNLQSLAVFPIEGAPRLVAGGDFFIVPETPFDGGTGYLAWFDGKVWKPLGGVYPNNHDLHQAPVSSMLTWDDGAGQALFVGGQFRRMGEQKILSVARWDGQAWSAMDSGLRFENQFLWATVLDMEVYDDGSGPSLYVAGKFDRTGDLSLPLSDIARWDGEHWQDVGGGVTRPEFNPFHHIAALAVYDDGSGPALYVGGQFELVGTENLPIDGLARWNGQQWSAVGEPLQERPDCPPGDCTPEVWALATFDDGTGPALFVGGRMTAPGVPQGYIARYREGAWEAAGTLYGHLSGGGKPDLVIHSLEVLDTGEGPALYAGGKFETYEPKDKKDDTGGCLARWDPASQAWIDLDANPGVKAITVFDDPDEPGQPRLWVGVPVCAGDETPGRACVIGVRTPDEWKGLPGFGVWNHYARVLKLADHTGDVLYVNDVDWDSQSPSKGMIRYDASGWSPVGTWTDLDPDINVGVVRSQHAVEFEGATQLFVEGQWYEDGAQGDPQRFHGVARWDGARWFKVGQDFSTIHGMSSVSRVVAYDDGSGPTLFAPVHTQDEHVYKLIDNSWVKWASGEGASFGIGGTYAAISFDDGTGPALWLGGDIGSMEGVPAAGLVRHRPGLGWDAPAMLNSIVLDFEVWDDPSNPAGPALYMSGEFTQINGKVVNRVARWEPKSQEWKPLGKGLNQNASLAVCDDGTDQALWAHGAFSTAGGKPAK
jgi:hypothetical protein